MPVKSKARKAELHRLWYERNHERRMLEGARKRAAERGLGFDLESRDVEIPKVCPALGIPLVVSRTSAGPGSPSIDRINNDLGYVRGNVIVVSHLANTIKSAATPKQLRQVVQFYTDLWHRKPRPEDF